MLRVRLAELKEVDDIQRLIEKSSRSLAASDYTSEQIEIALKGVWGLDTQLILDHTYFVSEVDGILVGCGGWSRRATLFGNDALKERDDSKLNPAEDAAKIRAFFVHPQYARRGIGSTILKHCEKEAIKSGYCRFELGATLPGQRLYQSFGYIAGTPYDYECVPGKYMKIVPMHKDAD
ncbi:MAG: GNAT family N-acetyltransferase [Moraxellaceae bacterium]|nr:MAG: GNAT family N-acetyltransferase [Moraxellaceae bacterium]